MMTVDTNADVELSLSEFLTRRARHSSDARLVLDAVVGFAVAISAILWGGPAWHVLASVGTCFLAYGAWGIADRELGDRPAPARGVVPLKVVRSATAIIGFGAAIFFVLGALGIVYGRFIS